MGAAGWSGGRSGAAPDGLPRDPVARFHVRNGASVERICPLGDPLPEGMASSLGFMVNYRYDPSHISANERTMQRGEDIPASWQVRRLAESGLGSLLFRR